jgi:heat shock protein beta
VNYPIYLLVEKDVSREVPLTEEELEARTASDDKTTKVIKEKVWEWEQVNENQPIWLRERDEIEEEEYEGFYKSLSKDSRPPMSYIHFTAEGELDFTSLLYIPSQAPYDMFQNSYGKGAPVRLYVRRVLITDNFEDLVPRFLNFVRGVVDSNDLPLNVSRENLQQKKILKLISKKITRKILQELKDMAEEDLYEEEDEWEEDSGKPKESRYIQFYKQFGKNLKLGLMDDPANKTKIAKLLRFYSTNNIEELTSFDDYIARMKVG